VLLSKVNGYVQPGMLLALMGPSGAGKTTLLDVLAARKNVGQTTGKMLINGKPLTSSYPRLIGYVEQFDMHFPMQTVQEALWFAAVTRLPSALPKSQKEVRTRSSTYLAAVFGILTLRNLQEIVNDIVALLEMESLRQMLVAGLNPEEQKRLSMGVELASLPAVLFLDEPTSGLDSHGADRVMTAIEKVAQSGTSVICTIHQPSSRVFSKATHLLLLRNPGQVLCCSQ
jgi:ABC-type multidrug transport system ATPase subunit